jgi:succinate--hydroxymethylglutarate CoA-transferase
MSDTAGAGRNDGARATEVPSTPNTKIESEVKPYVPPPFSASTEMILKRIRGEGLNANSAPGTVVQPPGYDEVRERVLQGMKTSMNMAIPETGPPSKRNTGVQFPGPPKTVQTAQVRAQAQPQTGTTISISTENPTPRRKPLSKSGGAKKGQKRKRGRQEDSDSAEESEAMSDLGGDSESDGSEDITPLPSMTQSGRKVVRPTQFSPAISEAPPRKRTALRKSLGRNAEAAICKRCGRGHSPASNMIVFCDGCNSPYHQMCHDPLISDEAVQDENKDWYCKDCQSKSSKSHTPRTVTPATANPVPETNKASGWAGKSVEEVCTRTCRLPKYRMLTYPLET